MATQMATKPIPHIAEPPFVGSIFEHTRDRLSLYLRVARKCGDVGQFHFGPFPVTLFNAPEHVQEVLVEHAEDFDKGEFVHQAFKPVAGNGLFTSEGETHRRQRKLMAPPFQPRNIVNYAASMVDFGEQLQAEWSEGSTIDIEREMTRVTMSVVGKVLFDADVFTEADELGAAMMTSLAYVSHTMSHLVNIPLNWPTPRNRHTRQSIALLRSRIQKMIDERRASSEEKGDFLSILLKARGEDGSSMSDEQVCDEALTLFGAGHETTATTLTWAWYLLAEYPECYQAMQEEVDSVLQGRSPAYADLARLPYTLQVFKEALRLYPPAYSIIRAALCDVEIDGHMIHKNELVAISPYVLHRRPDYFPEPEKFDPLRFTPEYEKQLPRYTFLPFGAGPRICIGNYFAMMEGQLLLATLAQRVTFELIAGQQIEPDPMKSLTLRPKYGIKMVVRRR